MYNIKEIVPKGIAANKRNATYFLGPHDMNMSPGEGVPRVSTCCGVHECGRDNRHNNFYTEHSRSLSTCNKDNCRHTRVVEVKLPTSGRCFESDERDEHRHSEDETFKTWSSIKWFEHRKGNVCDKQMNKDNTWMLTSTSCRLDRVAQPTLNIRAFGAWT